MPPKRIAVFISGRGSNFKAILDEVNSGNINGTIEIVVSDNPEANGLKYAKENGIESAVFTMRRGEDRSEYFGRIMNLLDKKSIDVVLLAGFMKVLSKNILERYHLRILNIHPALLPSFPGTHAQRQAVEYGVKVSGCTVHFVDEGIDTGPIILQDAVLVHDDDTEDTLAERILEREHKLYPEAVRLFCDNRLIVKGRRVIIAKR